jgi:hypothetical protein
LRRFVALGDGGILDPSDWRSSGSKRRSRSAGSGTIGGRHEANVDVDLALCTNRPNLSFRQSQPANGNCRRAAPEALDAIVGF